MANHDLTLRDGEYVIGDFFANHLQGDRGYGGRLFITNERLIFVPVAASRSRGGEHSEIELGQVSVADVAPRGANPRDGSLRRRLRVTTFSDHPEYFVVWRPRKLTNLLNGLLPSGQGT